MIAAAVQHEADESLLDAIATACARVAPTWPLDSFIAVNPYLGFTHLPVAPASVELAQASGTRLLMPRSWFLEQWRAGRVAERHLAAAAARAGVAMTPEALVATLSEVEARPPRFPLLTQRIDAVASLPAHRPAWCQFVVQDLSGHCAAWFDRRTGAQADTTLYAGWREAVANDPSPRLVMGLRAARAFFAQLPADPVAMISAACAALRLPASQRTACFTALLLSINGWAAWCAYLGWQARRAGRSDDHLVELLAMRLAWEWALYELALDDAGRSDWRAAVACFAPAEPVDTDWIWQAALEIAWREPLLAGLASAGQERAEAPAVQAVFCIDVRSEVMRRALEATDPAIATRGFAGFFGLPLAYVPLATSLQQARLPGIAAPALLVHESTGAASADAALAGKRRERLAFAAAWRGFKAAPVSNFAFVETAGPACAAELLADTCGWRITQQAEQAGLSPAEAARLKPQLSVVNDVAAASELAARVLKAMSLTQDFAQLVLFVAHGSESTNNAHAASLDCGACGGHAGDIHARALADLLNRPQVRAGLPAHGITIPASTWFMAGLHNTTTDELVLYDAEEVPATLAEVVTRFRAASRAAGTRARVERAASLGLEAVPSTALESTLQRRARHWSETRPEWGLAGNAAFVVAPRSRTRHLDLGGRVFLHDYEWTQDGGFATLESIMTAPLVVTSWINLQYYASTVDNQRYGSGNKVLHDVVGGNIGVFEGNGGDLRIGLPLQSLHDGTAWRHTPLRLAVFIEAPRPAIDAVLATHRQIRELFANEWLTLFQIDSDAGAVAEWRGGCWTDANG